MKVRMPYLSRIAGKKIDTFTCIQDLSGISMSLMSKQTLSLLSVINAHMSDHFPETLGTFVLINIPSFFNVGWNMVKGFVHENTRKKFHITHPSTQLETLKELLPVEDIPKVYGGECECPEGCWFSDKGPWA